MALRAITVGYDYDRISAAAIREIHKGNNLTRPSETEVLAAKDICELIPWCEMVKFGKNGSTVVSAAVKLARAFTGRKMIARCIDQPFFSYDDWFIGDTQVSRGVPEEIRALTVNWQFNNLDSLERVFKKYPGQIACIVCEPASTIEPKPGFLQAIIDLTHHHGAVVILDEMITGFRWHSQGACKYYDVVPDLVTFGKGMANGFSVAAVGGRREIMELGGLNHKDERIFLVSTTHGAEMCGLGAFRETLKVYDELKVPDRLWASGRRLVDGMNAIAADLDIRESFYVEGPSCSPAFICKDASGAVSMAHRTLFMQEMIKRGVLMPWIALCYEHSDADIDRAIAATGESLTIYKKALTDGAEAYLVGRPVKPVFRKFN